MPVSPNFLERLACSGSTRVRHRCSICSVRRASSRYARAGDGPLRDPGRRGRLARGSGARDRLDAHPDGIATLCEFLVAEGYLATAENGYRLTGMTETWLLADSGTNLGPWFAFWNEFVFPFWESELETAVRCGEPSQSIYEWFDEEPGRWEIAQEGFRVTASLLVEDVADAATVPDPAENAALFARVTDTLAPGGRIVVLDQWEGSGQPS